jgi:hypothetical protein
MPKIRPIRITKKDKKEFQRLSKNVKSKVNRTKKNYGVDLTGVVDTPKNIESFQTRKEYNDWKKSVSSFTNRANLNYQFVKNQHGLVMTKKTFQDAIRNEKLGKKYAEEKKKQFKDRPLYSQGEKQLFSVSQYQSMFKRPDILGYENPLGLNFENIDRPSRLERKLENLEKRAQPDYFDKRMEQMKENYMKALHKTFNSDADFLVQKFENIPAQDFYEMYLMFDEMNFDYHYTEDKESPTSGRLGMINSYVERYQNGDIDMSLKGF